MLVPVASSGSGDTVRSVRSSGAPGANTPRLTPDVTTVPAVLVAPFTRGMCPTSPTVDGPRAVRNATRVVPVGPVTVVPFAMGLVPPVPEVANASRYVVSFASVMSEDTCTNSSASPSKVSPPPAVICGGVSASTSAAVRRAASWMRIVPVVPRLNCPVNTSPPFSTSALAPEENVALPPITRLPVPRLVTVSRLLTAPSSQVSPCALSVSLPVPKSMAPVTRESRTVNVSVPVPNSTLPSRTLSSRRTVVVPPSNFAAMPAVEAVSTNNPIKTIHYRIRTTIRTTKTKVLNGAAWCFLRPF